MVGQRRVASLPNSSYKLSFVVIFSSSSTFVAVTLKCNTATAFAAPCSAA